MANRFKVPIRVSVDKSRLTRLMTKLQGLDKRAGRGAIKKGLNEVTQKVLWAAKGLVGRRSGLLRKALGRKVIVARGGAKILGIVKPRGGFVWMSKPPDYVTQREQRVTKGGKVQFKVARRDILFKGRPVNPARYAHLVEFGRVSVVLKKKKVLSDGSVIYGKRVKAVSPRPFMRPAWAQEEPNATPILHRHLLKAVKDYWRNR